MSALIGFIMVLYMMIAMAVFGFNMMLAFNPMDDDERKRASRRAVLAFIWPVVFIGMIYKMWKWSELGRRSNPLEFPKERADEMDWLRENSPRKYLKKTW